MAEFYGSDRRHRRAGRVGTKPSAELAKLLENTFRHVNIALVNELAVFAGELGVGRVERHRRCGHQAVRVHALHPGAPASAATACPSTPRTWRGRGAAAPADRFRFVELANDVNEHMPHYVVTRIAEALDRVGLAVSRSRVLVLGLAYKPDTSDARESPAATVAKLLADRGANVRVADPMVGAHPLDDVVTRVAADAGELAAADLVVLLTDHRAYDYDLVERASVRILDTRPPPPGHPCRAPLTPAAA